MCEIYHKIETYHKIMSSRLTLYWIFFIGNFFPGFFYIFVLLVFKPFKVMYIFYIILNLSLKSNATGFIKKEVKIKQTECIKGNITNKLNSSPKLWKIVKNCSNRITLLLWTNCMEKKCALFWIYLANNSFGISSQKMQLHTKFHLVRKMFK